MTVHLDGYGPVDTLVCDIDGVIVLGKQPIAGAGAALDRIRDAGLPIILATNNSTRKPEMVRSHVLDVSGFDPGPDAVVNSGEATAELLTGRYQHVFVVGTDGLRDTLRDGDVPVTDDWTEADAVVVGLDPGVTYDALTAAGLAIQNGADFYATNTDPSFPQPEGLFPGAGAIVAAVATTTHRQPIAICGKPHEPMRQALRSRAGKHPLIVGDGIETDIALGKAEGWATVLTLSGVIRDVSEIPAEMKPDVVVGTITELPELLGL
jgi:4-nitrophenyl phosphatase